MLPPMSHLNGDLSPTSPTTDVQVVDDVNFALDKQELRLVSLQQERLDFGCRQALPCIDGCTWIRSCSFAASGCRRGRGARISPIAPEVAAAPERPVPESFPTAARDSVVAGDDGVGDFVLTFRSLMLRRTAKDHGRRRGPRPLLWLWYYGRGSAATPARWIGRVSRARRVLERAAPEGGPASASTAVAASPPPPRRRSGTTTPCVKARHRSISSRRCRGRPRCSRSRSANAGAPGSSSLRTVTTLEARNLVVENASVEPAA